MKQKLKRKDAKRFIQRLRESAIKQQCWHCDCFQGLLTQLEIDCEDNITDLAEPLKVSRKEMHGCLGCEPCPPAGLFSEYIRSLQTKK